MRNHALTTLFAGTAALLAVAAPACAADPLTGSAAAGSVASGSDATAVASGSASTLPLAAAGSADAAPVLAYGGSALLPFAAPFVLGSAAIGSAVLEPPAVTAPAPVRPAPAPAPVVTQDPNHYSWDVIDSLRPGDCFTAQDGVITVKSCTASHNGQVFTILHTGADPEDAVYQCADAARRSRSVSSDVPVGTGIAALTSQDSSVDKVVCALSAPGGTTFAASFVH